MCVYNSLLPRGLGLLRPPGAAVPGDPPLQRRGRGQGVSRARTFGIVPRGLGRGFVVSANLRNTCSSFTQENDSLRKTFTKAARQNVKIMARNSIAGVLS